MAKYLIDSSDIEIEEVTGTQNLKFNFGSGNSLETKIGDLSSLSTTDKTDLVSAINEVNNFITQMPTYTTSTSITPTIDCIAEVTLYYSTWGYDGNDTTLSITCTNSPTELARVDTTVGGHNTVPDVGSCIAVYEFEANTTYQLSYSASDGGIGGNKGMYFLTKLIPIK